MLGKRIVALRNIETKLRRCCRELSVLRSSAAASSRGSADSAAAAKTLRPTKSLDRARYESDELTNVHRRERIKVCSDMRAKILQRYVPMALHRLERCFVVPMSKRKALEVSLAVSPTHFIRGGGIATENELIAPIADKEIAQTSEYPFKQEFQLSLVQQGLLSPRGPFWVTPTVDTSAAVVVASSTKNQLPPNTATTVLKALLFFEEERVNFLNERRQSLTKRARGLETDISNRAAALLRRGGGGDDDGSDVINSDDDSVIEDLRGEMEAVSSSLSELEKSIISRSYLSAFMWKALLQPDFLLAALGTIPSRGTPITRSSQSHNHHFTHQNIVCCAALIKLCLSAVSSGRPVNVLSPRFAVMMNSARGGRESLSVRVVPKGDSRSMGTLTACTVGVATHFLTQLREDTSTTAAVDGSSMGSRRLVGLEQSSSVLCDLMQSLQACCTALLILEGNNSGSSARTDNNLRTVSMLHAADDELHALAESLVQLTPSFAPRLGVHDAARALCALFRLRSLNPEQRDSQLAVSTLAVRMFPILATNTFATLSAKLENPTVFGLLSRKHRAKLRRQHQASTKNAVETVLQNTIAEHRVQTRRMAAALRHQRLSGFYQNNVKAMATMPLSSVALIFQIFSMTAATASRLPPRALRVMVGASCLAGEALLSKLALQQKSESSVIHSELAISLVMSCVAVLPITKQCNDLGGRSDPQKKQHKRGGEEIFVSHMLVYFLKCIAAQLAAHMMRGVSAAGEKKTTKQSVAPPLQLQHVVDLCDVLNESSGVMLSSSDVKVQTKEVMQMLKAYLINQPKAWWRNGESDGRDRLSSERRLRSLLGAFSAIDVVDVHLMDAIHGGLRREFVPSTGDGRGNVAPQARRR